MKAGILSPPLNRDLTVEDVVLRVGKRLQLSWLTGEIGRDNRVIESFPDADGQSLVGTLNCIHPNRIQIIGKAEQNTAKVESETARIRAVIAAKQGLAVQMITAQQELEVAKLERDAAISQAAAIINKAEGERDAIRMDNEAQSVVLKTQTQALGNGMELARSLNRDLGNTCLGLVLLV